MGDKSVKRQAEKWTSNNESQWECDDLLTISDLNYA